MRIHHLSCGSMCPLGGHLIDGATPGFGPSNLVCHCLLIESERGLILIDTGFGLQDVRNPHARLSGAFMYVNNIKLKEEATALRQIEKLGYRREDVRHIVLTHLDFDHAGGISDFPHATVHLNADEYRAAFHAKTLTDVARFRPQQWTGAKQWKRYSPGGEPWFGFATVRQLEGLPPDILLVPLVGHTFGHSGVAVETREGWVLHAGDAYFYRGEMDTENPYCTVGLRAFQTALEVDRNSRLWNQERLRDLKRSHGDQVDIICAHDHVELEQSIARERQWADRPVLASESLVINEVLH